MSHLLCFNLIQNQSHPFGYVSDNGIFHSNSIMLAWGPGTSLRRQKRITKETTTEIPIYILGALQLIAEDLFYMVTLLMREASGLVYGKIMCGKPWVYAE